MFTFEYADGKKIEFNSFPLVNTLQVTFPRIKIHDYQYGSIYVTKEVLALHDKARRAGLSDAEQAVVHVCVVHHTTKHPFPAGIFLPFSIGRWGDIQWKLDGLYQDHIYHPDLKPLTPIKDDDDDKVEGDKVVAGEIK